MSTTAQHASSAAPAPWKASFLSHLNDSMDSPEFVLATLHSAPAGSPTPLVPHARFCIFRGMWAELPPNERNAAPANPRVFESEMPTFTTDVRMHKVPELFGSGAGHARSESQAQGSGGGGPVEAVWWVKEVKVQWRIKGEAFVVARDIEGEGAESSGVRTVKSEVGRRMKVVHEGSEADWSWQTELTGHFGNLSPAMRGSFKQPPPGQPKSAPYDDSREKMGEKVDSLDEAVSRRNFRAVVIRPDEVEMLDLSNPDVSRRERYTYDAKTEDWRMETTWP